MLRLIVILILILATKKATRRRRMSRWRISRQPVVARGSRRFDTGAEPGWRC
jgi:hypothetical protein